MLYTIALAIPAETLVELNNSKKIIFSLNFFQKIVDFVNNEKYENVIFIKDAEYGKTLGHVEKGSAYLKGHALLFQVDIENKEAAVKINNGEFYPAIPSDTDVIDSKNSGGDEWIDIDEYDDPTVVMEDKGDSKFKIVDLNTEALCGVYFFIEG